MKKLLQRTAFTAILLSASVSHVYADEDTKHIIGGIAAGIVGFALNEMSQDNEAQADDIQWNDQKAMAVQASTLQYRDDIAETQVKLKKLGYYSGKVDGLKGSGTESAIRNWETDYGYNADGEISGEELAVLSEQAFNSQTVTTTQSQNTTEFSNDIEAIQRDLQKLGYYQDEIDRTNVFITEHVIKTWERHNDLTVDGKLNHEERQLLGRMAAGDVDKDISASEDEVTAYSQLYEIEMMKHLYDSCTEFKSSGNAYGYSIDRNLDTHMSDILKLTHNQALAMASCKGKTEEEFEALKVKAQKEYVKSDSSQMLELTTAYRR